MAEYTPLNYAPVTTTVPTQPQFVRPIVLGNSTY